MPIIATYGTLRYGGGANSLMRGAKYLGQDSVRGSLHNLGSFPGIVLDDHREVTVDLYEVTDEAQMKYLDRYEGYHEDAPEQSLYTRKKIMTNEGCLEVEVYEYNGTPPDNSVIRSGDWFDVD